MTFTLSPTTVMGHERVAYDRIQGCSPLERISTYHTYLKDRNAHTKSNSSMAGRFLFNHINKTIGQLVWEQNSITKDTGGFWKDSEISWIKKISSFVIGTTISGALEVVARTIHAVYTFATLALNATLGLVLETGKFFYDCVLGENTSNFSHRFSTIKDNLVTIINDIIQIARNAVRIVPIVGHHLGQTFDHLELAIIDAIERIASCLPFSSATRYSKLGDFDWEKAE